jgi:hypothetical protein
MQVFLRSGFNLGRLKAHSNGGPPFCNETSIVPMIETQSVLFFVSMKRQGGYPQPKVPG